MNPGLGAVDAGLPGAFGGDRLAVLDTPSCPRRGTRCCRPCPARTSRRCPRSSSPSSVTTSCTTRGLDAEDGLLPVRDRDRRSARRASLRSVSAKDPPAPRRHRPVRVVDLLDEVVGIEIDGLAPCGSEPPEPSSPPHATASRARAVRRAMRHRTSWTVGTGDESLVKRAVRAGRSRGAAPASRARSRAR